MAPQPQAPVDEPAVPAAQESPAPVQETALPASQAPPEPIAAPAAPTAPVGHPPLGTYEPEPELQLGAPKRRGRLWWGLAAALLLAALNVQALFYFRGAIALVWPGSRAYIEPLCQRLGCEIPLPKRAELMSIETSDLQAEPSSPGVMVLSATLRNRAAFPQALPALELTLTNEQDQPLARRVLRPAEYAKGDAGASVPSCVGGVASCEMQVRLFLEAAALKASGYRLYLFYP
jgi:hypothetical protein